MKEAETKKNILQQIRALPVKVQALTLEEAVKWSDRNPGTKPHFIIHESLDHVIIY